MKHNKKHIVLTALFPVFWVIVWFFSTKPEIIEKHYSEGFYPVISRVFRIILGWIPFSVGDFLGLVLIFFLLVQLFQIIKNKFSDVIHRLLKISSLLSLLYCCFYLFWGLNYFRKPLSEKFQFEKSIYTNEELITTTKAVITKLNALQLEITKNESELVVPPYTNNKLFEIAINGYENTAKTYPFLAYKSPAIKNSLISLLHSYGGTSGYINPITGEAQINAMIPKTGMPATICHEIAHQIGWNAENEANFIGFLTAIHNENLYFQYSGYRMAFRYLIVEVKKRNKETYQELWKTTNEGVAKDFKNTHLHWKQFKNPIEPYIKKGYNSYLKANNQTKGIDSYDYVVDLLIHYFKSKKTKLNES